MAESNAKLKNLFHPGDGRVPPRLTGRKQEQDYFQDCVDLLLDKASPDRNMIVYGPRGNGKTAMLRYLQKETLKAQGNQLDIAWATPSNFENLEELIDFIVGNDQSLFEQAQSLFKNLISNLEFSAGTDGASAKTAFSNSRATMGIESLLRTKAGKKPLVLIVDEAHTLDPGIGKALLNASQNVRGEDCPFLLVLAGTPNLETALSQASATFWDKSKVFPLGRLSMEDAQQALIMPLESCQVTCAEGVVEEMAGRAYRYPYFIQIWGDCIANRLHQTGAREVTMETIREIEIEAIGECATVYGLRYNELDRMGLAPLAADIGSAFTDKKYIPREEFKKLVGQSLQEQGLSDTHETIHETIRKLSHIGYIWQIAVPGEVAGEDPLLCYEPGIPSLMRYVRRQTLPQKQPV